MTECAYDYDALGLSDDTQRMLHLADGNVNKALVMKLAAAEARIAELEAGSEPVAWINPYPYEDCDPASSYSVMTHAWKQKLIAEGGYSKEYAETHTKPLYASPQPTDRNAVIEECVSEILSKGESEIAPAAFFAHALRALKTQGDSK